MQTDDRLSDWVAVLCRSCQGTGAVAPTAPACPACPACDGAGVCPRYPEAGCWYCDGSGVDDLDAAPTAELATRYPVAPYGVAHVRTIGTAGARATISAHGTGDQSGPLAAKGWSRKQSSDLDAELALPQALAA